MVIERCLDRLQSHLLWRIIELSLETLSEITLAEERLRTIDSTGVELCRLYAAELSKVDRSQRELENAVAQTDQGFEEIEDAVSLVREEYRKFFNILQESFLRAVRNEGWPFAGVPSNRQTFDKVVSPLLRNQNIRELYML